MKRAFLALCLLTLLSQSLYAENNARLEAALRAHIEFLADDTLAGRQAGTPGYDIAANYVKSQYQQIGLLPGGDEGSWFQQVPLREAWQVKGSARMKLERDGETVNFKLIDEFYRGASPAFEQSAVQAEMVFVGYGIDAPALDYNDYEGVDANGKIVVMIGGQPQHFPSEEGAHFASGREKSRAAVDAGAIGMVTVYTPRNEGRFAWERVESLAGTPSMGWLDENGEVFAAPEQIRGGAVVHYDPAAVLFEGADVSLEEILRRDDAAEAMTSFPLAGSLSLTQRSRHEVIESPNVIGVLPGSDPLLANETVIYLAHLDHIGVLPGKGHDDAINNGALDNASGVAVMIETARQFVEQAQAGNPARRSIMFIALTAEEEGLLGAEFYAQNPTIAEEDMVAVINLDMPMLIYDFADVIAFGASHSTLGATVAEAAGEQGLELTPDPFPDQNVFTRSDHYRFVQAGVPAVFLNVGMKSHGDGEDTMPIFQGFLQKHYHKPSDDLSLPINYGAAVRFTEINRRIGEKVANDPERPAWHEGNFFGETFSR